MSTTEQNIKLSGSLTVANEPSAVSKLLADPVSLATSLKPWGKAERVGVGQFSLSLDLVGATGPVPLEGSLKSGVVPSPSSKRASTKFRISADLRSPAGDKLGLRAELTSRPIHAEVAIDYHLDLTATGSVASLLADEDSCRRLLSTELTTFLSGSSAVRATQADPPEQTSTDPDFGVANGGPDRGQEDEPVEVSRQAAATVLDHEEPLREAKIDKIYWGSFSVVVGVMLVLALFSRL